MKNTLTHAEKKLLEKDYRTLEMLKTWEYAGYLTRWTSKDAPHPDAIPGDPPPTYWSRKDLEGFFPGDTAGILKLLKKEGVIWYGKPVSHKGTSYLPLRVLAPIQPNIARLPKRILPKTTYADWMAETLRHATLPPDTPGITDRWLFFDAHRDRKNLGHFLHRDKFAGRWYSPIVNMKKETRKKILLYGDPVLQLDVTQMHPRLLALYFERELGKNSFSDFITDGGDLYESLAEKAGLAGREAGKALFYKLSYGQPDEGLEAMFGDEPWIRHLNALKERPLKLSRRHRPEPKRMADGSISHHNNVAYLITKAEVQMMADYVWKPLAYQRVPYLTVHDAILVRERDIDSALAAMWSLPIPGLKVSVTGPDD